MVRTLRNAIATGRIAHAFMLTGVRGVGKTTTARIIARALNCVGPDGTGGPTVDPCGVCEHCVSIQEDRDVDVIEMDAASRTGVADARELIEGVRYRPVSARYKVYIIDEVHMLSNAGLQRAAEDAGRAAAAREVRLRHHRDPQGAGDGAVALPALRPQARAAGCAGRRSSARSPSWRRSRSRPRRWRWWPAPPTARCATGCRCSTRRSPMAAAWSMPRRCATCWAWPTAAA